MNPTKKSDAYPVFEPNQILSDGHLNQVFDYLDEQERLTRANLIGIGIVCGLEIRLEVKTQNETIIHLSKGCGVTSEGYLIIEPSNVKLVAYRNYTTPDNLAYSPFQDINTLRELVPQGEAGPTTPLDAIFLSDKAVLLFLELKKEGLRNCSPNNCDDKGSKVTATVRRLLIKRTDLDKIIAKANGLDPSLAPAKLEEALLARLNLPDLRLPRFDVPNTNPTSSDILAAFLKVFGSKLAAETSKALNKAYEVFSLMLKDIYPANPFTSFNNKFGFLDKAPTTTDQARFIQYYYDFFDDLLKAYDEFRWKGVELMCACCPPDKLFPRHLILGVLDKNSDVYRQKFLTSPAVSKCDEHVDELKQLFQRLVEMVNQFTYTPELHKDDSESRTDPQICITPSVIGDRPLADKAIPYYYQQSGKPPLYQLWSIEKTGLNRANQNLSYRSYEYTPSVPDFVKDPLCYDLEPYNFLRIEGHLGKDYQKALKTLFLYKTLYRLPIEIIALRTGAFNENIPVDLSKEKCRFQDLEVLYDTLRTELSCFLCKEVQYFYNLPYNKVASKTKTTQPVQPKLQLLVKCAPNYKVQPNSLGYLFEDLLANLSEEVIGDTGLENILRISGKLSRKFEERSSTFLLLVDYMSKLYDQLSDNLDQLDFVKLEKLYLNLVKLAEIIEHQRETSTKNIRGNLELLAWEELDDRLEAIIYNCRANSLKALQAEYQRRIIEIKQYQFLSHFLKKNPGIQHKAGVPLGGTFIIVYHGGYNIKGIGKEAEKFISELKEGTVIADFFLPYLCCSDCAPVQYVLPVPPLNISIQIACTDSNRKAEVTVTPQKGTAPYYYQLDDEQYFKELTGNLVLTAGHHTIMVRDSAGAESLQRSVLVPEPLTIGAETFIDNVETYQVSLKISGGMPPYAADSGTVTGSTFTSTSVESNNTIKVTIADRAGCKITKEFTHTVKEPCKLPCDGIALRRKYRFSLPVPDKNLIIKDISFKFDYPKDKAVNLTEKVRAIIQESVGIADWRSYFADQMNKLIAKVSSYDRWLIFKPLPQEQQVGLDTWEIEYFKCLTFEFYITWSYNVLTHVPPTNMITIKPKGSSIKVSQGESILADVTIPAFDGIRIDKCDPQMTEKPLCPEKPGVELAIIEKVEEGNASLRVDPKVIEQHGDFTYLWEVPDGSPVMANGTIAEFILKSPEPKTNLVRLTAFTKDGCRIMGEYKV